MSKFVVIVVLFVIVILSGVDGDEEVATLHMMNSSIVNGLVADAHKNGTINQNEEIYTRPATSNDVVNLIPNVDRRKPVRKRFELFLSKLGPFGSFLLNAHKGGNVLHQESLRPVFTPALQPTIPELTWQDPTGPHLDSTIQQNVQHQSDYIQVMHVQQQTFPPLETVRPSLDLSIKGPPIPNIQPLINALPGVLFTGYKSFLDKISSTSLVWDKAINLPFLSIKKSGKIGTSTSGPMTNVQANGVVDGHIESLIDIRDHYVENN